MWGPTAVGQCRVVQVIALSVEPPIPRYLRNPRLGDWPGRSSATGLAGTGDSSRRGWEGWVVGTPARVTMNGEAWDVGCPEEAG